MNNNEGITLLKSKMKILNLAEVRNSFLSI
jgi:hypothetical protein